ncbi:hypothetical protein [Hymenobacter seoulensis]
MATGLSGRAVAEALHTLLVDSTTMRAHQHVSGARKETERKPSGTAAAG